MGAEASRRLPPARWPAEPGVQSSAPGVRCPGPCGRPQRRSPREPAAWARAREFRPPRPAGTPHMATRLFSRHFLRWAPPSGTLCRGLTDGRGGPEEPGAARLVVCGVGGRPVRGPTPGGRGAVRLLGGSASGPTSPPLCTGGKLGFARTACGLSGRFTPPLLGLSLSDTLDTMPRSSASPNAKTGSVGGASCRASVANAPRATWVARDFRHTRRTPEPAVGRAELKPTRVPLRAGLERREPGRGVCSGPSRGHCPRPLSPRLAS